MCAFADANSVVAIHVSPFCLYFRSDFFLVLVLVKYMLSVPLNK